MIPNRIWFFENRQKIQGGAIAGDSIYLTAHPSGANSSRLYQYFNRNYQGYIDLVFDNVEDLEWDPNTDEMWTLNEYPLKKDKGDSWDRHVISIYQPWEE